MHIGLETGVLSYAHNVTHQTCARFLVHRHQIYELLYFVCGDADFLVEGVEYHMEPHTLMLFPPNLLHGVRVNSDDDYQRYILHFDEDVIAAQRRALLTSAYPAESKKLVCIRRADEFPVIDCLNAFDSFCNSQSAPYDAQMPLLSVMLEAALAQTLLLVSRRRAEMPPAVAESEPRVSAYARDVPRTIQNIITYLNENIAEPVSLDALCARFYISKHYLNRAFRKATGTTVMDYLIRKRAIYAQQLLISGVSANEAASLVGFSDYTAFYRAYRNVIGHSPGRDKGHAQTYAPQSMLNDIMAGRGGLEDEK